MGNRLPPKPSRPNANVVLFRDAGWKHDPLDLALTTVTFDVSSGNIEGADIEINSQLVQKDAECGGDGASKGARVGSRSEAVGCTEDAAPRFVSLFEPTEDAGLYLATGVWVGLSRIPGQSPPRDGSRHTAEG